jgi:hypothetical protein
LTHSSVVGHLSCFHNLAIMNSVAINISIQVCLLNPNLHYFAYMPKSNITESYGSFISSFLRNLHTAFYSGCTTLHFLQQCVKGSCFTASLPAFSVVIALEYGHYNGCEMKSKCSFDLHLFYSQGS